MKIHGFQKMTMLDFPGKIACTAFTAGCNFRCPFCHNAGLVTEINSKDAYTHDEIFHYLEKRKGLLDGVAVTGGEPLLYPETAEFLREIKDLGLAVKLDTNGSFPERLKRIVAEGLVDYVAMDVKNCKERYAETVGLPSLDLASIEESIGFLLKDRIDYEFRTTVVKEFHTPQDIEKLARWISGAKRYYLQNFVDSGHLIDPNCHGVSKEFMEELQKIAAPFIQNVEIRGI